MRFVIIEQQQNWIFDGNARKFLKMF